MKLDYETTLVVIKIIQESVSSELEERNELIKQGQYEAAHIKTENSVVLERLKLKILNKYLEDQK